MKEAIDLVPEKDKKINKFLEMIEDFQVESVDQADFVINGTHPVYQFKSGNFQIKNIFIKADEKSAKEICALANATGGTFQSIPKEYYKKNENKFTSTELGENPETAYLI